MVILHKKDPLWVLKGSQISPAESEPAGQVGRSPCEGAMLGAAMATDQHSRRRQELPLKGVRKAAVGRGDGLVGWGLPPPCWVGSSCGASRHQHNQLH